MREIQESEVIDHGYMYPDYFQGCGTAYTEYADVATGCGTSRFEAFEDACESLAQMGYETSALSADEHGPNAYVPDECDESYWYVSIRVR